MDIVYNLAYVFLLFFIYSVVGYIGEIIFCFIQKKGKLEDRGFLYGPYCPIYGFGSLLIIFILKRYQSDPLVLFVMTMLITTVLEYITSYLMEKIFGNKWWDYSDVKFNINGRISLISSVLFGIGGVILLYYMNPFANKVLAKVPDVWQLVIASILFISVLIDFILSSKIAYNFGATIRDMKKDLDKHLEESDKIIQTNIVKIDELTHKMQKKISKAIDGKIFNRLILKLPDISRVKIDVLTLFKHYIHNNKGE